MLPAIIIVVWSPAWMWAAMISSSNPFGSAARIKDVAMGAVIETLNRRQDVSLRESCASESSKAR
jgi:hypothetical protein